MLNDAVADAVAQTDFWLSPVSEYHLMRSTSLYATLFVVAVLLSAVKPAAAAGCIYPAISAQGPVRSQIQPARYAAMAAWERKVTKRKGRGFGVWNNAGDQTVSCTWNDKGNRIRCVATAAACSY